MDITFCDLRRKEVINIADGSRLGRPIDIVFNIRTGKICGIIVPGEANLRLFRPCDDLFIPWQNILRIGEDVVLIEFFQQHRNSRKTCIAITEREFKQDDCRNEEFCGVDNRNNCDK